MPQRTNEFQQLIYLIQAQLEGRGIVTESKLLTDSVTGGHVEVDVVVETAVNGIPLCIGIECNAEARPASVEWVREMFGKHDTLAVHSTVLVSKSGFSQNALRLAEGKGLTTLMLTEATDHDWKQYVAGLSQLKMAAFNFTPVGGVRLTLAGTVTELAEISADSRVRVHQTGFDGSLRELALGEMRQNYVVESFTRSWLSMPPTERPHRGTRLGTLTLTHPTEIHLAAGEWCALLKVECHVEFSVTETTLELVAAAFGDEQVAYGKAPNVFRHEGRTTQYVLLNMIGAGGIPSKASLLFPAEPGKDARLCNLKLTSENDATG